jgi:aminobenzoyl-glutamate utilization protein B
MTISNSTQRKNMRVQTKQDVMQWIEDHRTDFTQISDEIWAHPEPGHREFRASRLQASYLEKQGFSVRWDLGGLKTAFVAEWGSGRPIIGFAGEFDALNNLSQKAVSHPEPVQPGAMGHGCGHNLLGTGCLAAAVATKEWLAASGKPGTVRYYGCPSEENTYGKTFMARAGVFNDLDAAFNYHPGSANYASKGSAVGVYDIRFKFFGKAAHAGASPHLGRSALDAVELMNVGVNYLREHVTNQVRMHYVITHGGDLPNIVPAEAEVWYFLRAHQRSELDEVANRVRKIAQGAALMTETRMEEHFTSACSSVLNNHYLSDLQYQAMQVVGPIAFTEEEQQFAREVNSYYPAEVVAETLRYLKVGEEHKDEALLAENFPAMDETNVETGSTDVGDLSWITPLSMLNTTCSSTGAVGHSWGITACGGMSIGHKGMLHAAKIMALAAMDVFSDPQHLQKARAEFERATKDHPYVTPLPENVFPPRYDEPTEA